MGTQNSQRSRCSSSAPRRPSRVAVPAHDVAREGALLLQRTLRQRGLQQHLVTALVGHIELRANAREMHAQRVRRNAEPRRERRTIESLALARELLHIAEDADLAPGEAHAAEPEGRLVARRVVEHADRGPGIAALTADDRAHEVAELLVLGKALGGTAEDELGDLRLTAQERDVPVILGRAGRALTRESLAFAQLAALELRAREAQERVAPDRRAVLAEAELGARELVDGRIESTGEPVDEARRVRRPRDLGRVAHPRGIAAGRL